jgi:membrane protein DedA with SNARE-associated domain
MYGYTGVAAWVLAFFSVGFIFGEQWQYILNVVEHYLKVIFSAWQVRFSFCWYGAA